MADNGDVSKAVVIAVLAASSGAFGFTVRIQENTVTVVKDGVPEVHVLPERVPRKLLQRFSKKFGIPIEFFFHPDSFGPSSTTKQ